jgi:hypothetical protein
MQKVFLFILIFISTQLSAQQLVIEEAKFQTGDDRNWSQPGFNDSAWKTLKTTEVWDEQGYGNYDGFAWYRLHVVIPSSMREQSLWKDSLRIFLAKIDDADETFLNGNIIGKTGSFPADAQGYVSDWDAPREYHVGTNSGMINWNGDNIIAVRVYNGGGAGGIFGGIPSVSMIDLIDAVKMNIEFDNTNAKGEQSASLKVVNNSNQPIQGTLHLKITETETGTVIRNEDRRTTIAPDKMVVGEMEVPKDKRLDIASSFTEMNSGKTVGIQKISPYILTPPTPPAPQINGAKVIGVRPGSPFLYRIAATGEKPLHYSVENLPKGLTLDPSTGVITGNLLKKGEYTMTFVVKNAKGVSRRKFKVVCGNLLALTPPMGWNSWNCWGLSVSTEKVKNSAQAMIDKGLVDHGWTYMNIDDGWEAESRDTKGRIVPNTKFPDMKALGDWLHSRGLKFGIYSSPGPKTCGGYLGSYQHELQDAGSYAGWGIDYLKYDWCSYGDIHNSKDTTLASYIKPYTVMMKALRAQKRDILYSLCQYGMKDVWKWGNEVDGNCWRTTGDITDTWNSLSSIGFNQTVQYAYAKPGRWNDPDMMIVGQVGWGDHLHPTKLTPDEQYTHVSLWCLLSAPLLIGCDLSKLDDFTLNLLTNDEVLALDQDPLGRQARQIIKKESYQVWMKELEDGNRAIGIFNTGEEYANILVNWAELGLKNNAYKVRDLWRQKDLGNPTGLFSTKVAPHGVTLIKVSQ